MVYKNISNKVDDLIIYINNNSSNKETITTRINQLKEINDNELFAIIHHLNTKYDYHEFEILVDKLCVFKKNLVRYVNEFKIMFDNDEWESFITVTNIVVSRYVKELTNDKETNAYLFNFYLSLTNNHMNYYNWKKNRNHKKLIENNMQDFIELEVHSILTTIFNLVNSL